MAKLIYIFSLVIVCSVITANARECYVCNGCRTVDSSHRQTCPPMPTLPTEAPTTAYSSTSTSDSDPTDPSTSTSDSDPTDPSTSTSDSSSTDPSISSSDPSSESSSSNGPTSIAPSVSDSDPGSGDGSTTTGSTTTDSDPGSGDGPSGETPDSNEDPPSADSGLSPAQNFFRSKRSVMQFREAERENSNIGCIELVYEVAGETNFIHNCYYSPPTSVDEEEICQALAGNGNEVRKCNICYEDLCNSSEKATATIALIAASLITTFFYIKQ